MSHTVFPCPLLPLFLSLPPFFCIFLLFFSFVLSLPNRSAPVQEVRFRIQLLRCVPPSFVSVTNVWGRFLMLSCIHFYIWLISLALCICYTLWYFCSSPLSYGITTRTTTCSSSTVVLLLVLLLVQVSLCCFLLLWFACFYRPGAMFSPYRSVSFSYLVWAGVPVYSFLVFCYRFLIQFVFVLYVLFVVVCHSSLWVFSGTHRST